MKPLLDNFPAKRLASFLAILLVLGFQLVFFFAPQMGPNPYRAHERIALFKAWKNNPSEITKAAFDNEIQLEDHHNNVVTVIALGSFLVIDVTLFYIYWKCWVKKPVR